MGTDPRHDPVWASENFAEIVGFDEVQWRQFPYIDNIHPDDVELLERHLARQHARIRAGEDVPASNIDYRYRDDDGTYRTVNSLIRTAEQDGRTVIRGRNMDVTEERARESSRTSSTRS